MPELPEVETTRRGVEPHLVGRTINRMVVRDASLRWPIPDALPAWAQDQVIVRVERRSKYLFLVLERGTVLVHHHLYLFLARVRNGITN